MGQEEVVKQMMKQAIGITDEDFQTHMSHPKNRKIAERGQELMKYKVIAEVTESKYCMAGLKTGQKYTFNAFPSMLLTGESDCPLCVKAIGPIVGLIVGFCDKIIEGIDPNQGMPHIAECLDPGVKRGGLGHVVFKVYAQKAE